MEVSIEEAGLAFDFAHKLADVASAAILPYFRGEHGAINKGETDYDPVTLADKAAEQAMRLLIRSKRKNDSIIGEEFDNYKGTSGWTWMLDPIDGTRAFVAGTTTWGVLIGAYYNDEPVIGIMDQPFSGERWAASPVGAFWQRGNTKLPLAASANARIDNAVVATTDPYLFTDTELKAFEGIRKQAPITRYGLDCTAYSLLAQGGIGLVIESGLKDVDIAALIPIIKASGGVITDWHGNENPKSGQVIAAANSHIHAEALEYLKPAAI